MRIEDHIDRIKDGKRLLDDRQQAYNELAFEAAKIAGTMAEKLGMDVSGILGCIKKLSRIQQAMQDHMDAYPGVYSGQRIEEE